MVVELWNRRAEIPGLQRKLFKDRQRCGRIKEDPSIARDGASEGKRLNWRVSRV